MTEIEILKEVLKDPILREKYGMSEEEINNVSFDKTSNYSIIEFIKTIIQYELENVSNNTTYNQIKNKIIGIKD